MINRVYETINYYKIHSVASRSPTTTTEEDEEGNTMRNQLRHLMINYCNIFSPFSCLLHNLFVVFGFGSKYSFIFG